MTNNRYYDLACTTNLPELLKCRAKLKLRSRPSKTAHVSCAALEGFMDDCLHGSDDEQEEKGQALLSAVAASLDEVTPTQSTSSRITTPDPKWEEIQQYVMAGSW